MKKLAILCLILILASCSSQKDEKKNKDEIQEIDYNINPFGETGLFNKDFTRADLGKYFGSKNLTDKELLINEGTEKVNATILYPNTEFELTFIWNEQIKLSEIKLYVEKSNWNIDGLKVGNSLQQVIELNGNEVSFNGFEWDQGGLITDWHDGSFSIMQNNIKVYLNYDLDLVQKNDVRLEKYIGDGVTINSENPDTKKMGMKVEEIDIMFE